MEAATVIPVKNIDEGRLYTDLSYRYSYLSDFIGINESDIDLIHGSASVLGPRVDALVDAVYDKLFAYSCTKKVFFRERTKYDDPSAKVTLDNYDLNKPQIGMRKSSLKRFLVRLVTKPYDGAMLDELDRMGRIHTPLSGRTSINVELIHMQVLLAFLQDAVIAELYTFYQSGSEGSHDFDIVGTVRAFCKILAVLGQFISKWYERIPESSSPAAVPGTITAAICLASVGFVGALAYVAFSGRK